MKPRSYKKRKTSSKPKSMKRNSNKNVSRKRKIMKGGVCFNSPVDPSSISGSYSLNTYSSGDPSRDIIDSRQLHMLGGTKQVSRKNRTKRSNRRKTN